MARLRSEVRGFGSLATRDCQSLGGFRRFQVEPDGFFRCVKILKGLGFNSATVNKVLEGFPRIVLVSESEIRKRIELLIGIAFEKGVEQLVYVFPGVLALGVEDRLKPLLNEFMDLGFSRSVVIEEILREPKVLGMEVGELSRCLELLNSLKCRKPIKDEILSWAKFRAGFEVKLRVDCLCKHGLIRREAFKILWKEPRIVTYRIEDIHKKIEFLVDEMKYPVGCLVEVPEFLGVNFGKQIVPWYNVIKHLRLKGWLAYEVGLKEMIKLSRKRFYNFFVKPYPECEKMFGRFVMGTDLTKKQHPAGLWKLFKPPKYLESMEDVKNMKSFVESIV